MKEKKEERTQLRMKPSDAIRLIEDYEGKNIWEIWEDSHINKKEYGYIIKPTTIIKNDTTEIFPTKIIKLVGTANAIDARELWYMGPEDIFFHTHPRRLKARLSNGDLGAIVFNYMKGMGVIAGNEVKYWILPKDADYLRDERFEIWKKWEDAVEREDIDACYHYRAKYAANTRKLKKAIKLVYAISRHSNIDNNLLGITILAGAILFLWLVRQRRVNRI